MRQYCDQSRYRVVSTNKSCSGPTRDSPLGPRKGSPDVSRDHKTERTGVARLILAVGIRRQLTVVAALVLSGLADGFGLASLLPVVALVSKDPHAKASIVSRFVVDALARLGLPATLGVLLIVVVAALLPKSALRLVSLSYVRYA